MESTDRIVATIDVELEKILRARLLLTGEEMVTMIMKKRGRPTQPFRPTLEGQEAEQRAKRERERLKKERQRARKAALSSASGQGQLPSP